MRWPDSLFARCDAYERGTDCRALLEVEDCQSCDHLTDEEVCVELAGRFTTTGGDLDVQPRIPTPSPFPVAATEMEITWKPTLSS